LKKRSKKLLVLAEVAMLLPQTAGAEVFLLLFFSKKEVLACLELDCHGRFAASQ
jgi:hypothetical protein